MDNARPLVEKRNLERLDEKGKTKKSRIKEQTQPANSPNTNVNYLSIFHSRASRNHKLQRFASASDVEGHVSNVLSNVK